MQELTEKLRISEAIIKERMSKTGRTCGDCSLCCKLLPSVELNKPANIWCTHCSPSPAGGCSIYEHRQNVCRGFACAYLLANWIGDHWRPTRSHMVIHIKKLANGQLTGVVHVDADFPNAWQQEPYISDLRRWAANALQTDGPASLPKVILGERKFLILPNRNVEIKEAM